MFVALGDNVIIEVYGGNGFGIHRVTDAQIVGTVYGIGGSVYNVEVGDKVGAINTGTFFATEIPPNSYAVVPSYEVKIILPTPPSS